MRVLMMALLLPVLAAAPLLAQVTAGPEFRVNTYTTDAQNDSHPSIDSSGRFTITWTSRVQNGFTTAVFAQRYGEDGAPAGGEVPVNSTVSAALPALARGPRGNSMIVWHGPGSPGFDIYAQRHDRDGSPAGGEFVVNTYTGGNEYRPDVAPLPGGGFVVTWSGHVQYTFNRILARRYDAFGIPRGPEFQVSGSTPSVSTNFPSIASGGDGRFVIVWAQSLSIAARLYDASGNAVGGEFVVEPAPGADFIFPQVAMSGDGAFVVVWEHRNDGSSYGIRGRVLSPGGAPIGPAFDVNAGTIGTQRSPEVAVDRVGGFVVKWSSQEAGSFEAIARRFGPTGTPRSGDFRINAYTTGNQFADDVASDEVGNFVVSWTGYTDSVTDVFAQRFGGLLPAALAVDTTPSPQADGNGVLEPGEVVDVRPYWRNVNGAAQTFSGTMPLFVGPPGATYTIADAAADYGAVANGATASCSDCYRVGVSASNPRPAAHWDATAQEDIAPDAQGQRKQWRLHLGDSFADVPRASAFYPFVETVLHRQVTGGCAATQYCPLAPTTREQMSVFVVVARDAAGDPPPACTTPMFNDVPAGSPYCRWIEELARSGVVTGCGGGNFCPTDPVSRQEMAVFALRTLEPTTVPPDCGTPMFADVPASSPFCRWIEELARRGVVAGCGGGNYCPLDPVTREQMAVFISRTFGLRLYGP